MYSVCGLFESGLRAVSTSPKLIDGNLNFTFCFSTGETQICPFFDLEGAEKIFSTLIFFVSTYSCPNLVSPKSEELISRPFLGEIQFRLVLLKRMGTESAIGCLFFIL